jgi:low affinity Fe/Cu permease
MENKTRNDILLKERVEQIDDINFDKTFDTAEVATRELNNFDKEVVLNDNISKIHNLQTEHQAEPVFSIEIQPNEFFDNIDLSAKEEEKKSKLTVQNKPLFFTFTSIAVLLCILFIYNLFVINSLQVSLSSTVSSASPAVSTVVDEENNYILFENDNKLTIKNVEIETDNFEQTNWFDSFCNEVSELFGGSY